MMDLQTRSLLFSFVHGKSHLLYAQSLFIWCGLGYCLLFTLSEIARLSRNAVRQTKETLRMPAKTVLWCPGTTLEILCKMRAK